MPGEPINPGLENLRGMLKYMPRKGVFIWLTNGGRNKKGAVAGHKVLRKQGAKLVVIGLKGRLYYAHRLAYLFMTGKWPTSLIDHKDGDGWNNKWKNLRPATFGQNTHNLSGPSKTNTSGVTGVSWSTRFCKWQVLIRADGKRISLGYFVKEDFDKAVKARHAAEKLHYGEFAPNHERIKVAG